MPTIGPAAPGLRRAAVSFYRGLGMPDGDNNGSAFGHPGIAPTWASSSKDGIGTAYSTSSRVWFTLAQGILTEIYYPTIDRPQTRDAQFLVSDGKTFFHEEKRDMPSTVVPLQEQSLGYRVTSSDPEGRYRLIKEIIADPHQACVLIHTVFQVAPQWQGKLHLYALVAPHLEVGGWNNSAMRTTSAGKTVLLAWKQKTCLALGCSAGFLQTSCGFVGQSDGWQDLNDNLIMDWEFERAENGNVAMTAEIDLSQGNEFTLALAFGDGLHAATAVLNQSLALPFSEHRRRFIDQWERIAESMSSLEHVAGDQGRLFRMSRTLLLAHEDKTFAGALIASASIPWGDAMGDDDLGGYHLVWVRDMVNSATALLAAGDTVTPLRALVYLACSQQPDGGFPQNFWIDGTPYWRGIQLDEVSFPIMLAWRLEQASALREFDPYPMVKAAARYLIDRGPVTQQERWEECSGFSPSTLAANIAALVCAAEMAGQRGEAEIAAFVLDYADFLEGHLERWTVTTEGTLVPGIKRHYIRILPAAIGDLSPLEDPNSGTVEIANRPPGAPWQFPAREIVDAGFLELVRYGIRAGGDPLMEDSLRVIDALLKVQTPAGPCWRRYNHDGYGPSDDGKPYQGWGTGRAWPLLAGERAHYELAAGRDARAFITTLENFATSGGMLPEQVWDQADLADVRMHCGKPAGSATPLMWAHAEYIKLLRSVEDGHVFDCLPPVAERYLKRRGRSDLEIWKPGRRVQKMNRSATLRVQVDGRFQLEWSLDGWQTRQRSSSRASGLRLEFLDFPIAPAHVGSIRFRFIEAENADLQGKEFAVQLAS